VAKATKDVKALPFAFFGKTLFNGYSKAKDALDNEIESCGSRTPGPPLAAITRFRGQTAQTLKQRAEVRPDILKAWLGARVSRDHLRLLLPRRADALEKLNGLVDQILKTIDW